MKKLFSSVLTFVMIFTFSVSVFANGNEQPNQEVVTFQNEVTAGGVVIGSVDITNVVTTNKTQDGIEYAIVTTKDYTIFEEYKEEYDSVFVDSTEESTVSVLNDYSSIKVDGKELDIAAFEASTKELAASTMNEASISSTADRGGISSICHYYSNNARTNWAFGCYESMNYNWFGPGNGHGEPEGANASRIGILNTNPWWAAARNDINLFENAYGNYRTAYAAVFLEVGVVAVTSPWLGPLGLFTLGGTGAVLAGVAIAAFSGAVDAVEKAYDSVVEL